MTEATVVMEWRDDGGSLYSIIIVDDGDAGAEMELCEYNHSDEVWETKQQLTGFDAIIDFTIPEKFND